MGTGAADALQVQSSVIGSVCNVGCDRRRDRLQTQCPLWELQSTRKMVTGFGAGMLRGRTFENTRKYNDGGTIRTSR